MMSGGGWLDRRGDSTEPTVTMAHGLDHLVRFFKAFRSSPCERSELDSETASIVTGLQLNKGKGEPRSRAFKTCLEADHPGP